MKSPTPAIRQYMCCWLRLRNKLSHSAHRMALLYHKSQVIARKKEKLVCVYFFPKTDFGNLKIKIQLEINLF